MIAPPTRRPDSASLRQRGLDQPTGNKLGRRLLVAITAAAALAVAGCSAAEPSTESPLEASTTTPAPAARLPGGTPLAATSSVPAAADPLAGVDTASSKSVAEAVVATMFSIDTTRDSTPNAAALRAAPLLSADYIGNVTASDEQRTEGSLWTQWRDRGVHTTVTMAALTHTQRPPDTDREAFPSYRIVQQPITSNGEVLPPIQSYVFLFLVNTASGWKVTNLVQQK